MAWTFNPFSGTFDQKGSGGGSSVLEGEVATFADLPQTAGTPPVGSSYLVRESTGVWLVNRRQAGIYIRTNSTGVRADDWTYGGDFPVQSVNGEIGTVILDGSEIDTSGNDDSAAFFTYEFADGNGIYYPLPDSTLNSKRVYRNTTGHHVFFESLRWHITDGSPITANIIESSDDDNAAWPWLSAWGGSIEKAKLSTIVGRARSTFLFVGDSVPSTSVSGLGTAATSDSTAFAAASHAHGNLTNDGKIGTTANLPLKTGTNGVVEAGAFGTAAATFCEGNDARLSDDRDPNLHAASHLPDGADEIFDQSLNTGDTVAFGGIVSDAWTSSTNNATAIFDDNVLQFNADGFAFNGAAALALAGSITTSGLTQATARILGRTTASTGAVEEIQVGSGLSLSAGELSATVSAGIPATLLDAKGDLIVASAADTAARLAVGVTNGHVLTVDSAETLGVKWAAAAGGVGGGTGSTDNSILRSDGTGGSTLQASGLVVEDTVTALTGITGDAGTDIITATGSAFANGQRVRFTALTGGAGLNTTTNYFVINVSGATFQLSTTDGGSASLFTTNITAGTLLNAHVVQPLVQIRNAASDTNSSIILSPKGDGSIIAGPVPDGTSTGSNARGAYVVDLQLRRDNVDARCGGIYSALLSGYSCRATATASACVAGSTNTASGDYSFIGGSSVCTASGAYSTIIGGNQSSATSAYSGAVASDRALADRRTMIAQAGGMFATTGDAQRAKFVLRCKTTTNAAVEMALDGSTTYLTIPSGKVIFCNIKVVGVKSDGAVVATYERQYAAKNVAGTSSEVFAPVTVGTDNASSTSLEVATVDAGDYIRIRPTGITSEIWRWVASVDAVEVAYGS
jgi:hypothetical protein